MFSAAHGVRMSVLKARRAVGRMGGHWDVERI